MARLWTADAAWPVGARAKEFGDEGGRHAHFAFSAGRGGLTCIGWRPRSVAGAALTTRATARWRRARRTAGPATNFTLEPLSPSSAPGDFTGLSLEVAFGVLIFLGFEQCFVLGEEVEDPRGNVPKAIYTALALVRFVLSSPPAERISVETLASDEPRTLSGPSAHDRLRRRCGSPHSLVRPLATRPRRARRQRSTRPRS